MKLLVRTMRDKYGDRSHIVFTDKSGIANPLAVLDTIAMDQFIEMYYDEQQAVDKQATGKSPAAL